MAISNADLDTLRQALLAKRSELVRLRSRNVVDGTRSDGNYSDRSDAATRAEEEQELLDVADHEEGLLAEIEHALSKFDDGTFGLSEQSNRPIPLDRLRAIPWARLTADEEERRVHRR
jgi:DnaK suppressor protein